jgi:hypothetical protein
MLLVMPVFGLVLVGAGLIAAVGRVLASRGDKWRPLSTIAGFLVGFGALLLLGSVNTIAACAPTADFCGDANVAPLLIFAIAVLLSGASVALIAWRTARAGRRRASAQKKGGARENAG